MARPHDDAPSGVGEEEARAADSGAFTLLDAADDGAAAGSSDDEEWSIPDSAITFTREGWERYCAEAQRAASGEAGGDGEGSDGGGSAQDTRDATAQHPAKQAAQQAAAPPSGNGSPAGDGATKAAANGKPWRVPRVVTPADAPAAAASLRAPLTEDTRAAVTAAMAQMQVAPPPWADDLGRIDATLAAGVAAARRRRAEAAAAAGRGGAS